VLTLKQRCFLFQIHLVKGTDSHTPEGEVLELHRQAENLVDKQ